MQTVSDDLHHITRVDGILVIHQTITIDKCPFCTSIDSHAETFICLRSCSSFFRFFDNLDTSTLDK